MSTRRPLTPWQQLDRAEQRARAQAAGERLEGAGAHEVLGWAAATFGARWAVTSSMTDAVVVHLAARVAPGVDVLFLDTGYHFVETLGTRAAVATTLPVRVVDVRPARTVAQQDAEHGADLFARDPDRCCALRKVAPLAGALARYDAWATGLRREESATRAQARAVEWDERRQKVKVNPLVDWTTGDVDAYVAEHAVLVNPLVAEGYPSIGCAPCTRRVEPGEDARAGRWAGTVKVECGINA